MSTCHGHETVVLSEGLHRAKGHAAIIAWLNWPLILAVAGFVVYTLADTANEARATASISFARTMGDATGRAILVAVLCIVATARVIGTRDGVVRVFNLFFETQIAVDRIAMIDTHNGFEIVGADGNRIPVSVLGQSLMGAILGYRRSRQAASRYERWRNSLRAPERVVPLSKTPVRRLRRAWYFVPVWLASYLLLAISIRSST